MDVKHFSRYRMDAAGWRRFMYKADIDNDDVDIYVKAFVHHEIRLVDVHRLTWDHFSRMNFVKIGDSLAIQRVAEEVLKRLDEQQNGEVPPPRKERVDNSVTKPVKTRMDRVNTTEGGRKRSKRRRHDYSDSDSSSSSSSSSRESSPPRKKSLSSVVKQVAKPAPKVSKEPVRSPVKSVAAKPTAVATKTAVAAKSVVVAAKPVVSSTASKPVPSGSGTARTAGRARAKSTSSDDENDKAEDEWVVKDPKKKMIKPLFENFSVTRHVGAEGVTSSTEKAGPSGSGITRAANGGADSSGKLALAKRLSLKSSENLPAKDDGNKAPPKFIKRGDGKTIRNPNLDDIDLPPGSPPPLSKLSRIDINSSRVTEIKKETDEKKGTLHIKDRLGWPKEMEKKDSGTPLKKDRIKIEWNGK